MDRFYLIANEPSFYHKVQKQGIIAGHFIVTQLMVGRPYDFCRHRKLHQV